MSHDSPSAERRFVFLVQHGEATTEEEDPNRPLTVERAAAWAASVPLSVGRIQHSGKLRAEQTAALLAEKLKPEEGVVPVEFMGPNDDVFPVAGMLEESTKTLMLVGHLPFLSRLAGLLVTGDPNFEVVQFRMGGIVGLVRTKETWLVAWAVPPELF